MIGRTAKGVGTAILFLVILLLLAITVIPPFLDRIYYEGPASSHFDGHHFFNPDEAVERDAGHGPNPLNFLGRWLLGTDERPPWPETVPVRQTVPAHRVRGEALRVTWVGHATALIQTEGLNILTDPIWSDYATPFPPMGPKRVARPGIAFDKLPRIDVVLISHNHYDHLDLPTLRRLWQRDRPLILTSLGNDSVIEAVGAKAEALDWEQEKRVSPKLSVVIARNHHWGSRWGADRNRALWSGFVIRAPGGNIFFAGDTGPGDMRWPAEAAAYGPIRMALIPIGAFRFQPGQMANNNHIGPPDAVRVFDRLGAARAMAIHWGTFRLSWEARDTPARMLESIMRCHHPGAADAFAAVPIGTAIDVPAYALLQQNDAPDVKRCAGREGVRRLP